MCGNSLHFLSGVIARFGFAGLAGKVEGGALYPTSTLVTPGVTRGALLLRGLRPSAKAELRIKSGVTNEVSDDGRRLTT